MKKILCLLFVLLSFLLIAAAVSAENENCVQVDPGTGSAIYCVGDTGVASEWSEIVVTKLYKDIKVCLTSATASYADLGGGVLTGDYGDVVYTFLASDGDMPFRIEAGDGYLIVHLGYNLLPTPTPTNTPVPTNTLVPTDTPTPTNTLAPTDTPAPTDTSVPTNTPAPTDTPAPTNTPASTNTPVPTETEAPTAAPTAVLTYTLIYEKDADVTGAVPAAAAYPEGAVVTMASGGNLMKAGSVFAGWSYGGTTYAAGYSFYMPAQNVTLKAVFNAVPADNYILTYEKDADVSGVLPAAEAHPQGTMVTLADGSSLVKGNPEEYAFMGWSDGTTTYSAGDSYPMPAYNVTLKAVFAKRYKVNYEPPAELEALIQGELPPMEKKPTGTVVTLPTDKNNDGTIRFSCGNFPFIGWRVHASNPVLVLRKTNSRSIRALASSTGNRVFRGLPSNLSMGNRTLKALAGSVDGMQKSLRLSTTGIASEYWVNRNFSFVMPSYDVTFEPIFATVKYTLHFEGCGADPATVLPDQELYYGTTVTVNEPQMPGYNFAYWTGEVENEYGEKEWKAFASGGSFVMPKHDVTLRAVFAQENPEVKPLPEDEIGTYSFDEDGNKFYIQFHTYDICMNYMGDDVLCRNTSANLYN